MFRPDGYIGLTGLIESATPYSDPAIGDYQDPEALSPPDPQIETPPAPDNLAASGLHNGILFTWDTSAFPGVEYELWEHTSSSPFSSATRIWHGTANRVFIDKADTTTRYYWVTASAGGQRSSEEPSGTGVSGTSIPTSQIETDSDVGPITITKPGDGTTETIAQVLWIDFTAAEATVINVAAQFRLGVSGNPGFTVRAHTYRGTSGAIGVSGALTEKTSTAYENGAIVGTFSQAAGTYRAGLAVEIDGAGGEIVDAIFRNISVSVQILRP